MVAADGRFYRTLVKGIFMAFFTSGLFWFIEGVFACLATMGLKYWAEDRGIAMPWWKWLLPGLWILFAGFYVRFDILDQYKLCDSMERTGSNQYG